MQLTADYLISDCGYPQVPNATEYPAANLKGNCFPSAAKLKFHNYITSSRRRLLPRRESLSEYYDKLLMNSTPANTSKDCIKKQLPMQANSLKLMKCAVNEAIRKADKHSHSSSRNHKNLGQEDCRWEARVQWTRHREALTY